MGAEGFFFEGLQFFGDVALGVFDGLLARPDRRNFGAMRVSHFDVVAEDFVVADFQRGDVGVGDELGLILGQPLLAGGADLPQAVEFGIE